MSWLLDKLIKEWPMIKAAPLTFSLIVLIVGLLVYLLVRHLYNERIAQLKDSLSYYKDKASISQLAPAKVEEIERTWNKMTKIAVVNKTFNNEDVPLDGRSYSGCTFNNVRLVFNGDAPFDLTHNSFNGPPVFISKNPSINGILMLLEELKYLKTPREWGEYWENVHAKQQQKNNHS